MVMTHISASAYHFHVTAQLGGGCDLKFRLPLLLNILEREFSNRF